MEEVGRYGLVMCTRSIGCTSICMVVRKCVEMVADVLHLGIFALLVYIIALLNGVFAVLIVAYALLIGTGLISLFELIEYLRFRLRSKSRFGLRSR